MEKAKQAYKNLQETLNSNLLQVRPDSDAGFKTAIDEMKTAIKDYAPDWQDIFVEAFGNGAQESVKSMAEQYDFLKGKLDELKESYETLIMLKGIFEGANDETKGWLELWDDSALTNMKDANDALASFNKELLSIASNEMPAAQKFVNMLASANSDFASWINSDAGQKASMVQKLSKAVREYYAASQQILTNAQNGDLRALRSMLSMAIDLQNEMQTAADDVNTLADQIEARLLAMKSDTYDPYSAGAKRALRMQVDVELDEGNITDPVIRNMLHNLLVGKGLEDAIVNADYEDVTDQKKPKNEPKEDKTDHQLKAWQERFKKLKEAYSEFKRWYDLYKNEVQAAEKTKENPLFADLDVDPSQLKKNLETLRDEIKETTKARRDFKLQVGGEIVSIDYNSIKDAASKAADAMKEQLAEEAKRWNLAKQFNESGVNWDEAVRISFGVDLQVWDRQSRAMAERLKSAMQDAGMALDAGEEFGVSFKMNGKDAETYFGKNGDLYQLWKQTKDQIEKNGLDLYSKSAGSIKSFANIEEQIKSLQDRMVDDMSAAIEGGADEVAINGLRAWYNEQISKLRQEFFEGSDVYKKLTQDTTNFGVAKLTELRNLAKRIKEAMDSGTASTDKNGNLVRAFTLDGKDYEVTERSYESIVKLIAKLEKKSQSATESFKRMWKWLNGGDKELKFADVAKDIQAVFASLGETAEQLSQLFGTDTNAGKVASAIGGSFKGLQQITEAFDMFKSGDYLGGINGTLQGINTAISAIEAAMPKDDTIVRELENMSHAFETSFANLADVMKTQNVDTAYETYLKQQQAILDEMANRQQKFVDAATKSGTTLFGDGGNWHTIRYYLDKYLSQSDWDVLGSEFGVTDATDIFRLSSRQLYDLMTYYSGIWAKIQDAITADKDNPASGTLVSELEEYAQLWKKAEEATAAWAEYTIGIAFSDVESGFKSLITNLSAGWQDFTDSFEEQMFNAIVNSEVLNRLKTAEDGGESPLEEYYRLLSEYAKGGYTSDEIAELRSLWEAISATAQDIRDDAQALSGWDGGKAASSLSSAIQGVSAEQVDLLAAYANGIRGDMSVTRAMVEQMVLSLMPTMGINASAQLAQLNLISENTRQIAESNAAIRDYVESLDARLRSVTEGTERIYVR